MLRERLVLKGKGKKDFEVEKGGEVKETSPGLGEGETSTEPKRGIGKHWWEVAGGQEGKPGKGEGRSDGGKKE